MNWKLVLVAVMAAASVASCGGGGGGASGSGGAGGAGGTGSAGGVGGSSGGGGDGSGSSNQPSPPSAPSVSGVYSTDSSFKASVAPRVNRQAYFQVVGSNLTSSLDLSVTNCTDMSTVSTSASEVHFQCMPTSTAGTRSVTVKDQSGGTTLYTSSVTALAAVTPPSDTSPLPTPTFGFNLGNSLEAIWGYSYPSRAVFTTAAKAGFNAVRIPCAWDSNADQVTHKIDPAYMAKVKQAVDDAIAQGLYVFINVHWDGGWLDSHIGNSVDPAVDAKIKSYWTQIATQFSGYDNHLLFAAANEPDVKSPAGMVTLMAYYQTFINTVRAAGGNNTNRWLVLQGGGDTSWFTTLPSDPTPGRLAVEYHNYTPFQFTQLQGDASWGPMLNYWGPAYHYSGDAAHNVSSPEEGAIDSGFQTLADMYVSKGIPVIVGEFQAAGKGSLAGTAAEYNRASALYWNKYLVDSAHAHGLSPFYWSTPNSPFDYSTGVASGQDILDVLTGGAAPPPPNGAPYAVTGLVATNMGTGQNSLSWNAVAGATSYSLYRAAESGGESAISPVAIGITGTSYADAGLNDGTTYYYQVVAVNASGPSGFSPEAHATTPGVNSDPSRFNFESDVQGWSAGGAPIAGIATSTAQHLAGKQSLAVNFNGTTNGASSVSLGNVVVPAGATLTFHVWVPAGHQITSIEPIIQDYNWGWTQSWYGGGNLATNAWNTLTVTMPANAIAPLKSLSLKITTGAAWTGTLYMDSIDWSIQ